RGTDEQSNQIFGEPWRDTQFGRDRPHAENDLPLALVVSRWIPRCALDAGDLAADALALRNQGDELTINVSHALAQVIQRHIIGRHGKRGLCRGLVYCRAAGPLGPAAVSTRRQRPAGTPFYRVVYD